MISMYAEYSGRTLYVALSSDTIEGAKNGDTLYEMDTGKRYVYNETNDAWDEQPEEGGGGGGINLRLLGSGTYTQLANAQRPVVIPTDLLPANVKVLFKVESVDKTPKGGNRMAAWWRAYHVEDYLDPEVFPAPMEAMTISSAGSKSWFARASGNVNAFIWATADPGIGFTVISNSYTTYAGEYKWEVWGY